MSRPIVLAALFCAACAPDSTLEPGVATEPRAIIDGEEAEPGQWPNVGVLLMTGKVNGFGGGSQTLATMVCTGTLVARDVVLTAAHCVDDEVISYNGLIEDIEMYFSFAQDVSDLGMDATGGGGSGELPDDAIPVSNRIMHEGWDASSATVADGVSQFDDVGIAFLDEPVDGVELATLIREDEVAALTEGAEVVIVGYGQREQSESIFDPVEAGVMYYATSVVNELGDHEMQVGDEPPTPQKCHGDSGGPTFMTIGGRQRQIGITSHAYDETDCRRGGVDTRVDAYLEYIDATVMAACADGWRSDCEHGGTLFAPTVADLVEDGAGARVVESPPVVLGEIPAGEAAGCAQGDPGSLLGLLALLPVLGYRRRLR